MRLAIKFVLIFVTFIFGALAAGISKEFKMGAIIYTIIVIGMLAAIKAIWSYNPGSKTDITLNKDD